MLIPDKRELILARILEIGATIFGADNSFRNKSNIGERHIKAGAFLLVDADEAATDPLTGGRGRPANGPQVIEMTPEIYILLEAPAEEIGTRINVFRQKVIKAIMNDNSLVALCHNGDIRYGGFTTNLSMGRDMNGDSGVSFTFAYALYPSKLT